MQRSRRTFLRDSGLIVVEGPWDAMRVHQAGFPNVVALYGSNLTPTQAVLLSSVPIIVIMLDGDVAGRQATPEIAARFRHSLVRSVELPDGTDPAGLTDEDIQRVLGAGRALIRP